MHNESLINDSRPSCKAKNPTSWFRAQELDRAADLELSLGHFDAAELLSHKAAELREEVGR